MSFKIKCQTDWCVDSKIAGSITTGISGFLNVLIVNRNVAADNVTRFNTIQEAINAVESGSSPNLPILITPGAYTEDLVIGAIHPTRNIRLVGFANPNTQGGESVLILCTTSPLTILSSATISNIGVFPVTGSTLAEMILIAPAAPATSNLVTLHNVTANSSPNVSAIGVVQIDNTLGGATLFINESLLGGGTGAGEYGFGVGGTGTERTVVSTANSRFQGILWSPTMAAAGASRHLLEFTQGSRIQGEINFAAGSHGEIRFADALMVGNANLIFDGTGGLTTVDMSNCVWQLNSPVFPIISLTSCDPTRFTMSYVSITTDTAGTWVATGDGSTIGGHEIIARNFVTGVALAPAPPSAIVSPLTGVHDP